MHGKDAIVEEVLDWRPSDYFTVSSLLPITGAPKIRITHAFQDRANGATRIEMRVATDSRFAYLKPLSGRTLRSESVAGCCRRAGRTSPSRFSPNGHGRSPDALYLRSQPAAAIEQAVNQRRESFSYIF